MPEKIKLIKMMEESAHDRARELKDLGVLIFFGFRIIGNVKLRVYIELCKKIEKVLKIGLWTTGQEKNFS
jgi:hypothetical protein